MHCQNSHTFQCIKCERFINVSKKVLKEVLKEVFKEVLKEGYCLLSEAFRIVAPDVKYIAEHARRLLLQMPLVAVRIGDPKRCLICYTHGKVPWM